MSHLKHKRGIFDVMASLLEVLEDGPCNKTRMASRANLATRSSTRYINFVLRFNLVSKNDSNYFTITDKGRMFLEEYKKLMKLIGE